MKLGKGPGSLLQSSRTYRKSKKATYIMPACKETVKVVLGSEAVREIPKVSLTADTISCRVSDMPSDVEVILREQLILAGNSVFRLMSLLRLVVTLSLSPTSDTSMEI
jgi:hypothetical protein